VISALALLGGLLVGFVASRALRRSGGVGGAGRSAPELQRACFDAAVRHVHRDAEGRSVLPGALRLSMHPDDLAVVDDVRGWFVDELASALRDAAQTNGWLITGPISIDLFGDPARRRGAPTALALQAPAAPRPSRTAGVAKVTTASGAPAAQLVRVDTGERFALRGHELTIGRADGCDITVDDKRVSRHHATIRRTKTGWTITDEGSANGTSLGGRQLDAGQPARLPDGARLGIGPVGFEVRTATVADR
jgi:hypothetical protein